MLFSGLHDAQLERVAADPVGIDEDLLVFLRPLGSFGDLVPGGLGHHVGSEVEFQEVGSGAKVGAGGVFEISACLGNFHSLEVTT